MKILVTGGAGFIGSAVVRNLIRRGEDIVINVDKLTYSANLLSLSDVMHSPKYVFEKIDICDTEAVQGVFERHKPDMVMHLAAESHVDRSIDGPAEFVQTNILGTYKLLEASLTYYQKLTRERRAIFRYHHISTDEVFGALELDSPTFNSETPYRPRSPYSASKAASDHLALAWHHTYGLPVILSNCSNNYGPYQFPEKLIPLMILNGLAGQTMPLYGAGKNIRDWLFVGDHAEALITILKTGRVGETYLVGGDSERRNIDVVRSICELLDELVPTTNKTQRHDLITFVEDRPGHDLRYAIDFSKTTRELGWRPSISFDEGLRRTVAWYVENGEWWGPLVDTNSVGERLGLRRR